MTCVLSVGKCCFRFFFFRNSLSSSANTQRMIRMSSLACGNSQMPDILFQGAYRPLLSFIKYVGRSTSDRFCGVQVNYFVLVSSRSRRFLDNRVVPIHISPQPKPFQDTCLYRHSILGAAFRVYPGFCKPSR